MSAAGCTILVVDDDADVLTIYERVLTANGYRVVCVTTGAAAVKQVEEEQPGLVILDLAIPDVGGLALAQALRSRVEWNAMPILAISALGEAARRDALAAGCSAFHTKPIGARALLDAIGRFIERPRPAVMPVGEEP